MGSALTIVMYHYVRPLEGSLYPRLKGLELSDFEGQLDYLQKHYHPVSAEDVVCAYREQSSLPDNSVLVTFDDGYSDHHKFVMPALKRRGMTGVFFPPSCSVEEREILDVHKIHFILASADDSNKLVQGIEIAVEAARQEFNLQSLIEFRSKFFVPNRFDTADINYVKRMLQVALPEVLRKRITAQLFHTYVSRDEASFADDLYVSSDNLCEMLEEGMEIGSHGHAHYWLNSLSKESQARDIDRSLDMLERIGLSREGFYFCYPYGGYNEDTVDILASRGCAAAFTTQVDLARPSAGNFLELPRLDTNDLPRSADAEKATWTCDVEQSTQFSSD
jgi:peptidoglycan/xylan/chitin deacetylase (PgdA/CDA1 family)